MPTTAPTSSLPSDRRRPSARRRARVPAPSSTTPSAPSVCCLSSSCLVSHRRVRTAAALLRAAAAPPFSVTHGVRARVVSERRADNSFQKDGHHGLAEATTACSLGECDAFISHSWSDAGTQRWAALSDWADAFQRMNRRAPLLWVECAPARRCTQPCAPPCTPCRVLGAHAVLRDALERS
jgi:hypothetical protein